MQEFVVPKSIPSTFDMIKEEDIPLLVQRALKEGNPLYPVPRVFTREDFTAIYKMIQA